MPIENKQYAGVSVLLSSIDKPTVGTGDYTFLTEGTSTTSVNHAFCAAMIAVTANSDVLVAHVYPHAYPGKEFKALALRGPRALNNDFGSAYILLQHLFAVGSSSPLALHVLSEYYRNSFWRGFEVAEEILRSPSLAAEYAQHRIGVQAWVDFLDQINYVDLSGEHRPYDVKVTRTSTGIEVKTVGRDSDDVYFEI